MKIYFLIGAMVCIQLVGYTQTKITIKKNTVLHYMVHSKAGKDYAFDVTISSFSSNGIKFAWMMGGDVQHKGNVTIYKTAIENAITYRNYFKDNSTEKMVKESTVWLSKKNFKELTTAKASKLSLDFSIQKFEYKEAINYSTTSDGKAITIAAFAAKSSETINNLVIANDATNPLILKMEVNDFTITLQSITQK
jgi:hypothetical protein